MCAVLSKAVFCSFLISYFPDMLIRYFLNGFDLVSCAQKLLIFLLFLYITCVAFLSKGLYNLETFSASFSWNCSTYCCWLHNVFTLHSCHVSTSFSTCLCQCLSSNFTLISLRILKRSGTHITSCLVMYCSFASVKHSDTYNAVYRLVRFLT